MVTQKNSTRGFTLIELLVVITIIGILATGGISVFTTQLQKARDSTRQSNVKQYQVSAEQYMSDNNVYPPLAGFTGAVAKYASVLTQDPKYNTNVCTTSESGATKVICDYAYNVGPNGDNIIDSAMKLTLSFENAGNVKNIALDAVDGGSLLGVYEIFAGSSGSTMASGSVIRK